MAGLAEVMKQGFMTGKLKATAPKRKTGAASKSKGAVKKC